MTHHTKFAALLLSSFLVLPACSSSDSVGGDVGSTGGGSGDATVDDAGTAGAGDTEPGATADTLTPITDPDDATGTTDTLTAPGCDDCEAPAVCVDGFCVAPEPGGCEPGATDGCLGGDSVMTCDPEGQAFVPLPCPSSHQCLEGECVPELCQPGEWFCDGLAAKKGCNEDGTGFLESEACPAGWYCTSGKCTDACFADPKFGDYVGCSYWTVDLPNWPDPTILPTSPEDLPHALVISNPNEMDAEITFEPPPGVVMEIDDNVVPAGQSKTFQMPVINTEGTGIDNKGIRFSSTRPILAHQFNPWKAIWSNDASLLLPESYLGSDYVILSWPTDPRGLIELPIPILGEQENVNGFFTVVAPHDDTEVVFQVTGRIADGPGVTGMDAGGLQTVTLNKGEILNVECEPEVIWDPCDLTGSTVSADKPVAVFAGHESAGIGNPNAPTPDPGEGDMGGCCLDHLEEQMLPKHVLDTDYLAVHSKPRGSDPDLWRLQAAEPNVTITTDPPIAGIDGVTLAKRGEWVEVYTELSFEIHATGKLQVGQYFIGQGDTDSGTGDPSLMLAVPSQRFRDFYVLTVPPGYDTNWLTIIRPAGVTVAGANGPIPDSSFAPFGSGTWEFAYVELDAGVHKLAGDEPFGLMAYGYNGAMSYGYIGGID